MLRYKTTPGQPTSGMLTNYSIIFGFTDIDECLQATYESKQLCSNNTYCVNIPGSFDCVCIPGYEDVDGVCSRK